MRGLLSELDLILEAARALGFDPAGLPEAYEPLPCEDRDQAKAWALALHARFTAMNEFIWPHEEEFGKENERNRAFRNLGDRCHKWYEDWKVKAAFALDMRFGDWPVQPCLRSIFDEGLKLALKGDKSARRLMMDKWGFEVSRRGIKVHGRMVIGHR
jgi:hypothetical protein